MANTKKKGSGMKILTAGFMALFLLAGCCLSVDSFPPTKCSSLQLDTVIKQTAACMAGGYMQDICYNQAKFEQCDVINLEPK